MEKDKKPRRRKSSPAAAPKQLPAPQESVRVERHSTAGSPFITQVASAIRTAAATLIDLADAAAEAVTKAVRGARAP